MTALKPKFDLDAVNFATWRAAQAKDKQTLRVMETLADPRRDAREAARECVVCHYLHRGGVVCQGFSQWTCAVCGDEQQPWPNSSHPKLCLDCAKQLDLCGRCGADFGLKQRKNLHKKR